jgi:hypothetical protein
VGGYDLIAYAGNAEDVVLMRAFAGQRDGFFVDVGAGEPVSGSLTKNLVDGLGWRAKPGFDLLKVDVEGAEAAVLGSADLRVWRPRVIVVEATVPLTTQPSHQKWEPYVLGAGYRLALFDGLNRFYARDNELDLRERLAVPANVLDNYIPYACARRAGLIGPE